MYDMYYNWEDKQLIKQSSKSGKKEDCLIYWLFLVLVFYESYEALLVVEPVSWAFVNFFYKSAFLRFVQLFEDISAQ